MLDMSEGAAHAGLSIGLRSGKTKLHLSSRLSIRIPQSYSAALSIGSPASTSRASAGMMCCECS
jgi:hypothetical protein